MSRILIVTPAPPGSLKGNRVTADRWAVMLRSLGHRVRVAEDFARQVCDLLIALHASKSAASVARFAQERSPAPIILALTGTDLYQDIRTKQSAQRSLELASRLVLLQPHGRRALPARLQAKVRVIYQSAEASAKRLQPLKNCFEVCVSGHLRAVKDPFRAALAARQLPSESRIRITHLGASLSPAMEKRARAEMQRNPRYRWMGEVSRPRARQLLARSRLLVLSSKMEGGANVISEALAASVPVLATRIAGSTGLLGQRYPGYFDVGDTQQLATLLRRSESDETYYEALQSACRQQSALIRPSREKAAWRTLLAELKV